MNPTPVELALIAAALCKDKSQWPGEKLQAAHTLWIEANFYLQKVERDRASRMPKPPEEPKRIPLEERLAQLMPKIEPAMRKKNFHSFFVERLRERNQASGQNPTEEEREAIARELETSMKKEGVLPTAFEDFPKWYQDRNRMKKSKAGQLGAKQMHANKAKREAAKKTAKEAKKRKPRVPHNMVHPDEATLDSMLAKENKFQAPPDFDRLA